MRPQHQVRAQSPNRRVTFETPNLEYQLMQVTLNSPLRTEFSPSSPSVYSPQRVPSPKPFIPPIYTPPRALKPNLPTPIPVARAIEAAASTAVPRKRIVVVNTSQFASPPRRVSDAMKDALGRQRLQPSASSPTNTEDNNELVFSPKTPSSPTLSGIMKGQTFTLLFGPTLARSDGKFLFSSQLSKLQFVVLFFGANWCEASVKFSAVLKSFREKAREKGVKLEVVFCSVDRDMESFDQSIKDCGFLAIPFLEKVRRKELRTLVFNISAVPSVVFLDSDGVAMTHPNFASGIDVVVNSDPSELPFILQPKIPL